MSPPPLQLATHAHSLLSESKSPSIPSPSPPATMAGLRKSNARFIEELADCGIVREAAARVGMTEQSAAAACVAAPMPAGFDAAWGAAAVEVGLDRLHFRSPMNAPSSAPSARHYFHGEISKRRAGVRQPPAHLSARPLAQRCRSCGAGGTASGNPGGGLDGRDRGWPACRRAKPSLPGADPAGHRRRRGRSPARARRLGATRTATGGPASRRPPGFDGEEEGRVRRLWLQARAECRRAAGDRRRRGGRSGWSCIF